VTIRREDVLAIARLAAIDVQEAELPVLVAQLNRIVGYVAQLESAPAGDGTEAFVPGPTALPLREDVVRPEPLSRPPAELAPAWRGGYFVVPRLAAMEEP
jgi:aspartyl/glutamyl-tRNA(Asn/Gln) amidotransferase C subunit